MGKGPLAAFDIELFRHRDLEQMADRRGENELVGFKILIVLGEAAERLRDVVRDRGLLGDDEGFAHKNGLERCGSMRAL